MRPREKTVTRLALCLAALLAAGAARGEPAKLLVCADPNNLPFSNEAGEGFENKLAELVAHELGREVAYIWWAQRRGFVRNTLKAGRCEVVMGVPAHYELVATTRPYYRSTYVFVSRADSNLGVTSLADPALRRLAIGVHLIGDDGANTPPADALGREGIVDNVVGFMIYGDYRQPNPPARLIDAVVNGEVDIAAAWGPLAGYFAQRAPVKLRVVPIADADPFKPLAFEIAMGVRKGNDALRAELDEVIERKHGAIDALLDSYGVPRLPPGEH